MQFYKVRALTLTHHGCYTSVHRTSICRNCVVAYLLGIFTCWLQGLRALSTEFIRLARRHTQKQQPVKIPLCEVENGSRRMLWGLFCCLMMNKSVAGLLIATVAGLALLLYSYRVTAPVSADVPETRTLQDKEERSSLADLSPNGASTAQIEHQFAHTFDRYA